MPSSPGSSPEKKLPWHWLPAIIGVSVIALESTGTMSAEHTSRWLLPAWIWLMGPTTPEHWAVVHHLIRKTGHLTGYGSLSIAWFYGWNANLGARGWSRLRVWSGAIALAIVCTFLTACADEFHQSFLPSRTSSFTDVEIDTAGAIIAQSCTACVLRFRRSFRRREV